MKLANKTPEELIVGESIMFGGKFYKTSDIKWDEVNQKFNVYYYTRSKNYVLACKKTDQLTVKSK